MYYIFICIIGNKTTAMMPCRHYRALRMEKVHGLSHYTWVYESIYLNLCFYKCDICIFIRNSGSTLFLTICDSPCTFAFRISSALCSCCRHIAFPFHPWGMYQYALCLQEFLLIATLLRDIDIDIDTYVQVSILSPL